jgi:hypothetical protein
MRSERGRNAVGTRLERGRNAVGTRSVRGWNAVGTRLERGRNAIGTRSRGNLERRSPLWLKTAFSHRKIPTPNEI